MQTDVICKARSVHDVRQAAKLMSNLLEKFLELKKNYYTKFFQLASLQTETLNIIQVSLKYIEGKSALIKHSKYLLSF